MGSEIDRATTPEPGRSFAVSISIIECPCGIMMICLADVDDDEAAMAERLAAKGEGLVVLDTDDSDAAACPECGRQHDLYDGDFVVMHPAGS
jgi:hypothetical protein